MPHSTKFCGDKLSYSPKEYSPASPFELRRIVRAQRQLLFALMQVENSICLSMHATKVVTWGLSVGWRVDRLEIDDDTFMWLENSGLQKRHLIITHPFLYKVKEVKKKLIVIQFSCHPLMHEGGAC